MSLTSKKIVSMRSAGQILADTFVHIDEYVKEGVSARQVD